MSVDSPGPDAVAELAPAPSFSFVARTDLFANHAHLREGFDAAFVPFLPALAE